MAIVAFVLMLDSSYLNSNNLLSQALSRKLLNKEISKSPYYFLFLYRDFGDLKF